MMFPLYWFLGCVAALFALLFVGFDTVPTFFNALADRSGCPPELFPIAIGGAWAAIAFIPMFVWPRA